MNIFFGFTLLFAAVTSAQVVCAQQRNGVAPATIGNYTTDFPLTENPISESGKWINSGANGGGRSNVQSASGLAFGTQIERPAPGLIYNDSIALMTGTWSADQTVTVTLHEATTSDTCCAEGEIWIRGTMDGGKMMGYEMSFSILRDPDYYHMATWLGKDFAKGTFARSALGRTLHDGDVIKVTAVGNAFTLYVNSIEIARGKDSSYKSGNPGIGFYHSSVFNGLDNQWGFRNFSASGRVSPN
jgi:hypothetical protein